MQMKYFALALCAVLALTGCQQETEVETVDTTATAGTTAQTYETATPSVAGDVGWGAWNDWDTTADNRLTRDEYDAGFNRVYTNWAGSDNSLAPDEARDTWRDWFDNNNDDIIDNNEWTTASRNWNLEGLEWGEYNTWDADRNNQIDTNEWNTGFERAAAKARWTRDELANAWWDFWDGNNDDIIDNSEWTTRRAFWGDNNA